MTPHSNGFEESFLYYFLPLENLEESIDRNPVAAIQVFPKDQAAIVVTCGTKDWLYPRNLEFVKKMDENRVKYKFYPIENGEHEEKCFQTGLWTAMEHFRK